MDDGEAVMRRLKAILVDDEPLALKGLALRLAARADVEVVATAGNGRAALKRIAEHRPDVVFLDIQMPGIDGLMVARALVGEEDAPLIVFVTAYDAHAVEAFRAHALDYLLKPVTEERLAATLARLHQRIAERDAAREAQRIRAVIDELAPEAREKLAGVLEGVEESGPGYLDRLAIRDRGRVTLVATADIDYIDAAGDYLCIHVGDDTHILRETMKTMEAKLDPVRFQRIHRSTIVNLARVRAVEPHGNGECFFVLEGGRRLKVSRSRKAAALRLLNQL